MHITYISSFVPRKCGIATYTRDLSMEMQNQHNGISIIAMENPTIPTRYQIPVIQKLRQNVVEDYKKTAIKLNNSATDVVHLQHEFGLFGSKGVDGEYILELASRLTKPLVTTFHTVFLTPSDQQKYVIQELARLSRKVIVMDDIARDRLEYVYKLNPRDTDVIRHGAPIINMDEIAAKKSIGFSDSYILLANNLLSRNKGIEYAIEAVGKAVAEIPNLIFLIVGETHPLVVNYEGESYRNELIALVKKLHLEKHVIFINEYVSLEKLQIYLAAADVYITPYLDPQQITSGTLSYAIGAGKACIATEYVYAKDLLAKGRGALVPFRDSDAIANALVDLYKNPKKREEFERRALWLRKDMQWPKVAEKHTRLYKYILLRENHTGSIVSNFISKPLDISYLEHLTDDVGVVQHSHHFIPNRKFGYSIDDVSRALIVVSNLYRKDDSKHVLRLIKIYLSYLHDAQVPDGRFHNFLTYQRTWDVVEDVNDSYGRAMWGLGYYLYIHKNTHLDYPVRLLFSSSIKQLKNVSYIRTAAYTILGLYYYILAYDTKTDEAALVFTQLKRLADVLVSAYDSHASEGWDWFEEMATYDNFRLPQALFAAYMVTEEEKYKDVAVATLQFITNSNYDKQKEYFDFIGQNGWYKKGGKKAAFDQQPLEAAAAVEAYIFAARALKNKSYLSRAIEAFEWYFGKNRNYRHMYDENTKGVFDGLIPTGVNQNEGAESIIGFLMAQSTIQQHMSDKKITQI